MIKVDNLSKSYPSNRIALKSISFEIKSGEICGFLGTNGAGKSTTAQIIAGILNFDEGVVNINGKDIREHKNEIKSICGFVPENNNIFSPLTITELIDFIAKSRSIDKNIINKRLRIFSELFDFKDYLNLPIATLSKGNKQKILITTALIHNPEIIILDEPINGLDANSTIIFMDLLSVFSKHNKSIFYCSHLLNIIENISDRIIIIDSGEIKINEKTDILISSNSYSSLESLFREIKKGNGEKKISYEDIFEN